MLSHQLQQNRIDGEKTIIQNPSEAQRKEHDKFEFELHEVYAVDVLISSGIVLPLAQKRGGGRPVFSTLIAPPPFPPSALLTIVLGTTSKELDLLHTQI